MKKVRDDLEKGYKVDLIVTTKRGQEPLPLNEMQRRLEEMANDLSSVSKEWKGRDVRKSVGVLSLQGIPNTLTRAEVSEQ